MSAQQERWAGKSRLGQMRGALSTLYEFGTHPAQSILNHQPIEILGKAVNVDPNEQRAVLKAIRDWESPVPKWTDWQDYDPSDVATHPDDGKRIEIQLENGRVVQGIYGAGILGTIGIQTFFRSGNPAPTPRYSPRRSVRSAPTAWPALTSESVCSLGSRSPSAARSGGRPLPGLVHL